MPSHQHRSEAGPSGSRSGHPPSGIDLDYGFRVELHGNDDNIPSVAIHTLHRRGHGPLPSGVSFNYDFRLEARKDPPLDDYSRPVVKILPYHTSDAEDLPSLPEGATVPSLDQEESGKLRWVRAPFRI